jgi:C4-dicarboxylate-specific signal transduction histidine kinase
MTTEMQKTGIDVVGDMLAWGSHFCLFYETKEDLLDALVLYCKSGLERGEYCLWIVAQPLTIEQATDALNGAIPDLERHFAAFNLEIVSARDWYLNDGRFDGDRVTRSLNERLARISAAGYAGLRVTGDMSWLIEEGSRPFCEFKAWKHLCDHEEAVNQAIGNQRLAGLCTYPLAACGALEILDVVRTHQFAIARRRGTWDIVETAALKQAKAEIRRLNEELEQRVVERTNQLMLASEALREAQTQLAHVNRVATMGELSASIAHEVMQPIAATVTNAQVALRFLSAQRPNLEEARQALGATVKAGKRTIDVIDGIRALIKKAPPRKDALEINDAILEVIALTRGEIVKNGVSVQTQLAEGLPLIQGDRVQLQQVILNLIINAVEAMSAVSEESRELLISTEKDASGGVLVAVRDSGPGLNPESFARLFDAFYTTKPGGTGMGLSICRSIVEAHGGRIWASVTAAPGTVLQCILPVG